MAVKDAKCKNVAAIFGVTGLVGKELARMLLSMRDWKVYGVARRPAKARATGGERHEHEREHEHEHDYHFVSCDLLNPWETQEKLSPLDDVTHIFWVTWASQFPLNSPECYQQNKAMMANALNAILLNAKSLTHVSLQTGTKHYVSLQGPSRRHTGCYDEQSPRVDAGHNFYYGLEDLLQERLPGHNVAWSVHRPGVIMGSSQTTVYNFIGTICVYGAICKYMNLPFVFGGTRECWEEMYIDASDARLVAEQHIWVAANHDRAGQGRGRGRAFNAINGECYTWQKIWPAIGAKLGVDAPENGSFSGDVVFSSAMADKGGVWREIVEREGLVETRMEDLANWDLLDVLFRFPVKMLATRSKIDSMGFKTRYHVLDSICYWIDAMRKDKFIP